MAVAALSGMGLMAVGIAFIASGLHQMRQQERAYRQSAYHNEGQRFHPSSSREQQATQAQAAETREDR